MLPDLAKIQQFTSNGTVKKEMFPRDLHFLRGYKPNTLLGYNATDFGPNLKRGLGEIRQQAIKHRLAACRAINSPTFFSYGDRNGVVTHLTKDIVNRTLQVVWEQGGFQNLTCHSVRVRGASLRYAMEVKTQEICKISQWTLNCYELYMRVYSKEEKDESVDLTAKLNQLWETEGQGDSDYGLKPKDVGTR
ncbi:hypothetical protein PCANC_00087 [Puccinia coronata f. sp. avenae]|uniref:Uncharacterized protein n=1 Tax=Puccinia coronata f. sp. avenae TaxID=200324 RepID=A0A2N5W8A7_9BASI|nr:hypothetical protein PCANC_00087 [Puccinia coronata f. sp. avenae]